MATKKMWVLIPYDDKGHAYEVTDMKDADGMIDQIVATRARLT